MSEAEESSMAIRLRGEFTGGMYIMHTVPCGDTVAGDAFRGAT